MRRSRGASTGLPSPGRGAAAAAPPGGATHNLLGPELLQPGGQQPAAGDLASGHGQRRLPSLVSSHEVSDLTGPLAVPRP
eukprot:SAG22_NODE_5823_length_947_cov_1.047170_1_plen_79_part_10